MTTDRLHGLVRLLLTPGLGPTLAARLLRRFGDPGGVIGASPKALMEVEGIGATKAARLAEGLKASAGAADRELTEAARLGVRLIAIGEADYPPLLATIPRAPMLLYVRGRLEGSGRDRYAAAIVGSRACTAYGIEQAERFGGALAEGGVTVVSGGARGIDSAAHRGALRARRSDGSSGRTVAVLGCGLSRAYPPENRGLFDAIVEAGGAVVSELPMATPPSAENFPARNRIISGMALGVVVIEAARQSGALITARVAGEDHGREVMALPGRVDSPASEGSHELLQAGGAHLVTGPGDVLHLLETPARHAHAETHADRYGLFGTEDGATGERPDTGTGTPQAPTPVEETGDRARILTALDRAMTPDELSEVTGLAPAVLRAELTLLEIQGRVRRTGLRVERR